MTIVLLIVVIRQIFKEGSYILTGGTEACAS